MSRPLDRFLAGSGLTITEFQIMVILQDGPARVVPLACRLRLDPGHVSRALARLRERGIVRREFPWPRADWSLEPGRAMDLELLEPGWFGLNEELNRMLGPEFSRSVVRVVDSLRHPVRMRGQGWTDD